MCKAAANNIVLIGMPASGKSTVGVILAKILGMDFLDTDLLIQKRSGMRLPDLIEAKGISGFMSVEEEVCASVDVRDTVIATGGSVVYGRRAMEHLKHIGTVVYLKVGYEILMQRLHNVRQRGVVLKEGQSVSELYKERTVLYEAYADITVSEEGREIEETVTAVAEAVSPVGTGK